MLPFRFAQGERSTGETNLLAVWQAVLQNICGSCHTGIPVGYDPAYPVVTIGNHILRLQESALLDNSACSYSLGGIVQCGGADLSDIARQSGSSNKI